MVGIGIITQRYSKKILSIKRKINF